MHVLVCSGRKYMSENSIRGVIFDNETISLYSYIKVNGRVECAQFIMRHTLQNNRYYAMFYHIYIYRYTLTTSRTSPSHILSTYGVWEGVCRGFFFLIAKQNKSFVQNLPRNSPKRRVCNLTKCWWFAYCGTWSKTESNRIIIHPRAHGDPQHAGWCGEN